MSATRLPPCGTKAKKQRAGLLEGGQSIGGVWVSPKALPLLKKAQRTNKRRDQYEREVGLAPPLSSGPMYALRTAGQAIVCGMETQDWDAVAEGLDILLQISQQFIDVYKEQCREAKIH